MDWLELAAWLDATPLWVIGPALLGTMLLASYIAMRVRDYRDRSSGPTANETEAHEGYIVSATLGLLALLMGFTFSLAVDRFETRRQLVREEAQAISTAYFRTRLLGEPYRDRTRTLLLRYLDNRVALAKMSSGQHRNKALAVNDALIADIEDVTAEAFETIKDLDWSSAYLETINRVTELDLARKVARAARGLRSSVRSQSAWSPRHLCWAMCSAAAADASPLESY